MKINKFWWISLSLVIALAFIVFIPKITKKEKAREPYFNKSERFCVNQICISKNGDTWRLEDETGWPADNEVVEIFNKNLEEIKLTNIASTNKEKFTSMGFDDKKIHIEKSGKKLEIGKINSGFSGTYVKEEGVDEIYLSSVLIDRINIDSVDYWKIKNITNWPMSAISEVKITNNNKEKIIKKDQGKWADDKIVAKLENLSPIKYLKEFNESGSNIHVINASNNGVEYSLIVGSKQQNRFSLFTWVKVNNIYYEISLADYRQLTAGTK